jgi:hypothetical protein
VLCVLSRRDAKAISTFDTEFLSPETSLVSDSLRVATSLVNDPLSYAISFSNNSLVSTNIFSRRLASYEGIEVET